MPSGWPASQGEIELLEVVPARREPRRAVRMREARKPGRRGLHDERRERGRKVARARESGLRVQRQERRQHVLRAALSVQLERRDRSHVRRLRARCARRVARDLEPRLPEGVDERRRPHRPQDRDVREMLGNVREQARRKPEGRPETRRREVRGRPRPFLEVPRVDLARRAGKKEEDHVPRRAARGDLRGGRRPRRRRGLQEPRRDEAAGADLEEATAGELGPGIRRRAGSGQAREQRFHGDLSSCRRSRAC